jgi:hypothetical protein
LFDSLRGATKKIDSSDQSAEATQSDSLVSFDSTGYTLGADTINNGINYGSNTHVGWAWKAGGTGVTNNVGDITSSVSANADAGFSMVKYTGTGTGSSPTVGHGLGGVPEFFVVKNATDGGAWAAQHKFDTTKYFQMQDVDAAGSSSIVFDSTAATATVFTVNSTNAVVNASGKTYIAYLFRSIEGHSKISTFTGNGSTDGTFVYTGGRPAWIMIKSTTTLEQWHVFDSARDTDNVAHNRIRIDSPSTEDTNIATGADNIDILSNGFKIRSTGGGTNTSGQVYIYICMFEIPFKYTTAR